MVNLGKSVFYYCTSDQHIRKTGGCGRSNDRQREYEAVVNMHRGIYGLEQG